MARSKSYLLNMPSEIIPPTEISKNVERIFSLIEKYGVAILKPLDGFSGDGIYRVEGTEFRTSAGGDAELLKQTVESLTENERKHIMVQKYIPDVLETGDKRILVLDGEPIGAYARIPPEGSFKANYKKGGIPAKVELSERDIEIVEGVRPFLERDGLFFVGLDVIGSYLTEINVQSPGGIHNINTLNKLDRGFEPLEKRVVSEFVQKIIGR